MKAVVAFGGSVSATRKVMVNDLVLGLRADGIWNKLDCLWLFAAENTDSALTDIIERRRATNANTTTFTANRGYTGDGISMAIDSNFNVADPTSAPNPHFARNSACLFAWSNTPGSLNAPLIGATNTTRNTIYQAWGDDVAYFGVNDSTINGIANPNSVKGLYLANRSGANAQTLDINGVQFDSNADASVAPDFTSFIALRDNAVFSTRQVSCMGFGASLSATERVKIYDRIHIYMGQVGNT